jgi:four helix bundle protein
MSTRSNGSRPRKAKPAPVSRTPLRSHKDLEAYQRSMELLVHVHELCDNFPVDERRKLAERMRTASEAIPASIAEGFGHKLSEKEFRKYIKVAMASASKMRTHLRIAGELGFVEGEDLAKLTDGYSGIGPELNRLIANWKRY